MHSKESVLHSEGGRIQDLLCSNAQLPLENDNPSAQLPLPLFADAVLFDPPWGVISYRGKVVKRDQLIPTADIPAIVSGMINVLPPNHGIIGVRCDMDPMHASAWWAAMKERGLYCHVVRIQDTADEAIQRCGANLRKPGFTKTSWQWIMASKSFQDLRAPREPFSTFVLSCLSYSVLPPSFLLWWWLVVKKRKKEFTRHIL